MMQKRASVVRGVSSLGQIIANNKANFTDENATKILASFDSNLQENDFHFILFHPE